MNSRSGSGMLMRIRSQHFSLTRIPTLQENQMNGEYDQSIDTFRDLSDLVLELADYLARGLLAR